MNNRPVPSALTERGRPIYGDTPPGGARPCERESALADDELETVVTLIACGRLERQSVVLPKELETRHWDSVLAVMLRLDERLGWAPGGWKVGAASEEIRRSEGLPGSCPGRIYRDTVFESPASLPPSLFINYRNCEGELAFRLGEALPSRAEPYTEAEVAAAIECVMPAFEIGDMVFADWYGASRYFGSCLDNGGGAAFVYGNEVREWHDLDLSNARLELRINGQFIKDGFGRAAMGHPLTSLTWLVNWLRERGRGLVPGEVVSTGTCTGHCFAAPGDLVELEVTGLGRVTAFFE